MLTLSYFYWNDPFLQLFSQPERIKELVPYSKAQVRQDLFVLQELNFKSNGFFVEIGAANGVAMSNTWLLEKKFEWKGILSEPSSRYYESLPKNRSAFIDNHFCWSETGIQKEFLELGDSGLSTLSDFAGEGIHGSTRMSVEGKRYVVESISLGDLLEKYSAPKSIDYISIDVEGAEMEILKNFQFDKYAVKIWTIEHNFEEKMRLEIFELMSRHGYARKFVNISHQDDWYVLNT
jgi:FkbM family methyltransferase